MEKRRCARIRMAGESKLDRLAEKLAKVSFVALDTAVFIYQFEKNNNYFKLTKKIKEIEVLILKEFL